MSLKSLSPSSNWSELPSHLQALFMNKLVSIKDYIRFGAVCNSWRSVFTHYLEPKLPLLMIPSTDIKDETLETTRKFYCLSEKTVLNDLEIKLPYRHCRGSKHGWLVLTSEEEGNLSVRLYNPFSSINNEIELPPLTYVTVLHEVSATLHYVDTNFVSLKKAFPSKNPTSNPNDYVVIGIIGAQCRLAFCKPSDKAWSILPSQWQDFEDVTYYKGLFYAVRYRGEIIAINFSATDDSSTQQHPMPEVKRVAPLPPSDIDGCIGRYIVESSGDLLQVQRFYDTMRDDDHIVTNTFRVFKLVLDHEQDGENSKWIEVKTLDGRMLFLGDNASFSLSASYFPRLQAQLHLFYR